MRFGFRPRLMPINRRYFVQQLRDAITWARNLGLQSIELTCTEDMASLGLQNVFGGEFMETLMSANDLRFHLHLYYGEHSIDEVAISDTSARARGSYLRKLCHALDYFETNRPMQLYVLGAGPHIVDTASHMRQLAGSLDCIRTLYPDIKLAIVNGRPGTVLERPTEFLDFLSVYNDVGFVFDSGWGFQSVGYSRELFSHFVRSLTRFADRLAAVHWKNVGPATKSDVPLHVPVDRGADLPLVARHLGRNPATVHIIETAAAAQQSLLARDRRVLVSYFGG